MVMIRRYLLHRYYLLLFISFIVGCAAQQVFIDRAVIRNETDTTISNVRVQHEPTGKIGQVYAILPMSELDLGLPRSPMLAKRSVITWENQNGQLNKAELELPQYHQEIKKGESLILRYTIYPGGRVMVDLTE